MFLFDKILKKFKKVKEQDFFFTILKDEKVRVDGKEYKIKYTMQSLILMESYGLPIKNSKELVQYFKEQESISMVVLFMYCGMPSEYRNGIKNPDGSLSESHSFNEFSDSLTAKEFNQYEDKLVEFLNAYGKNLPKDFGELEQQMEGKKK